MEAPYYAPPQQHTGSSGLTIGFPLGTGLLLLVVIIVSGIMSCCYHWDKLRHLRGQISDHDHHYHHHHHHSVDSPSKLKPTYSDNKRDGDQSLPVIMAGDQLPRFIAMPCPCEPLRSKGKFVRDEIQMPPTPPHVVIPMD
ncbi:hypothetical protein E3N88_12388 [Mikania micrantha]|uniref:Hydroxyproline-rich glycoprotein family protein n=1 Tax=Mikania micrantha TaxID=192012 RepID=A0A5N6P6P1_9ASTR|nr:hypothetical protein E3N88_12388 [Mikania micrantha]